MIKRKITFGVLLFIIFSVLTNVPANGSTLYEYVIDEANIFDDSNYMIQQLKNLRSKLDVNIHVYSVEEISQADKIFDEYVQDSTALILVVAKDGSVDWYTGSVTKKILRDYDMEEIIASNPILDKQYTTSINEILQQITACSMGEENIVIDTTGTYTNTQDYTNLPNFIITFVIIFIFTMAIIYAKNMIKKIINKIRKKKKEEEILRKEREEEKRHIIETPLEILAKEKYEKIIQDTEKNNEQNKESNIDLELEKLKSKYDVRR